ncbi:hypothetical protein L6164_012632 [Bauhinia variegata]|uniref:Uncharacterized protein n=1 Tax=Bauhinia variegata TaxID=167791 RepID=A0ACB9PAL1_BAUVA|nr:hypothetical protein L6164_012632 [Bauhinia variegata]
MANDPQAPPKNFHELDREDKEEKKKDIGETHKDKEERLDKGEKQQDKEEKLDKGDKQNDKEEKQKSQEEIRTSSLRNRATRYGFSDSFATIDLASLEIEGVAECSSRDVPEDYSSSFESEASSSNPGASDGEGQPDSRGTAHSRGLFRLLRKGPHMRLQNFHPLKNVPKLARRKSKRVREDLIPSMNAAQRQPTLDADQLSHFKSSWKNFSFSQIQAATNDFSHENLLGEGGYAEVYLGKFEDGQFVAIKKLTRGNPDEMAADFLSELGIIVHVDHPNIAKLIGYGVEGGMFLILQLSPNGSLSSILYGPREKLNWAIRYKIALGTAEGLWYLHEGCQRRIIHKDIKAANILLMEDFGPQISDFGLAKWLPDQWTHHTVSKVEGTFGYLPPEFFMHGIVDEKTDVFAYGVLLLELISGRQAIDSSQKSLVMWAKPLISQNKIKELIDSCLAGAYNEEEMNRLILTASACVDQSASQRPDMNQALRMLKGDEECLKLVKESQKSSRLQRTYSEELLDAEEYNSTKLLQDPDQLMAMILSSCNSLKEESTED